MKVLAILQARTTSSRLPNKVLLPILGEPLLAREIERIRRAIRVDNLVVATSEEPSDDPIEELCGRLGISCHRGSLNDVLERFLTSAAPHAPDWIVRLTGDCPLIDPKVIDDAVAMATDGTFDYVTNALEPTYPDGLDVEVVSFDALQIAGRESNLQSEREHVTPFIHQRPERFRIGHLKNSADLSSLRWTVDTQADLDFVRAVYERLYPTRSDFTTADVLALLSKEPELGQLNNHQTRNEGYMSSRVNDKRLRPSFRYAASETFLERALKSIPLGSQTFSKSRTQYPFGVSPYFITRGQGSHVWDIDDNEYVDYINSLCAITLGYNDPDVTTAVRDQLQDGVIFSLPHPIETEVAELIIEMVPCAEMVRFGKNGSDATAGAIRLARAFTRRDHVAVCGYHGWQDWYIGSTTRNLGVPSSIRDLTHTFMYNDPASLHKLLRSRPGEFAAVILEPMNVVPPSPGFLESVKEIAHSEGALLIFDETITGFRFSNGGAQEKFDIKPDLATFGKGLANGYPLSAVAGRADIMTLMEEVFFSFTFGGETLSLAAAKATLSKLRREPVVATLRIQGEKVKLGVESLIRKHGCEDFLSISGDPTWSFLLIKDCSPYTSWQIKTLFMQELFSRGILAYGTHNISYSHSDADVDALLRTYDCVFELLRNSINERSLEQRLRCEPLQPLFKVR